MISPGSGLELSTPSASDEGDGASAIRAYAPYIPLGIAVGSAGGAAHIVARSASIDATSLPTILFALSVGAVPGAVVGLLSGISGVLAAGSIVSHRWLRMFVALVGATIVPALFLFVPWLVPYVTAGVVVGLASAIVQAGLAERSLRARSARAAAREDLPETAIAVLAVGFAVAIVGAVLTLYLVREVLHVGCSWLVGGEAGPGVWTCADGVGYGGVGLSTAFLLAFSLFGAVTAALYARFNRTRARLLFSFALVPPAGFGCVSFQLMWQPAQSHPDGYGPWLRWVLPALVLSMVAVLVLFLSCHVRRQYFGRVGLIVGCACLLAAVIAQPLLLSVTVATGALAVAAHASATTTPERERPNV